jgi:hypothetical protein
LRQFGIILAMTILPKKAIFTESRS